MGSTLYAYAGSRPEICSTTSSSAVEIRSRGSFVLRSRTTQSFRGPPVSYCEPCGTQMPMRHTRIVHVGKLSNLTLMQESAPRPQYKSVHNADTDDIVSTTPLKKPKLRPSLASAATTRRPQVERFNKILLSQPAVRHEWDICSLPGSR